MMRAASLLGLCAVLAACTPVDRAPPASSVALPDAFALAPPPGESTAALADLLPVGDPGFRYLSEQALVQAPDLAIALARIDAARAGLRGAGAARLPELAASANAARERLSANQFGTGNLPANIPLGGDRTTYTARIDASWDADLFGRLRATERAAALRLNAADADAAAVRLALVTDIAQAVTDYRALSLRQSIIDADQRSAADFARLTGERARAGLIPGADQARADALAADAVSRAAALGGERAAVIGRLVTLTGLDGRAVQSALADRVAQSDLVGAPSLALPASVIRSRPDVRAAERRLAAADQAIAAAAAERFPRLSITAGLGLFALALGDLFTDDAIIGSVGAGLAGPLVDFGRVGALIGQRQAEGREAFGQYRAAVFRALGEVEAALGQLAAAQEQVAALERQALLDGDALSLARERYRMGLDPILNTIDAERTTNRTREALALARAQVQRQRIALYRAAGGA